MTQVAIIGAGPYGLSIAANLRALDLPFRIFGTPMDTWRRHMPVGMTLKSDGFASNLCDAQGRETLAAYCSEQGLPYRATNQPVELDVFNEYAMNFQQRLVAELEDKQVVALDRVDGGFSLELDNGEKLHATLVVVAVGITHFQVIPDQLATLPPDLMTHSSTHRDLSGFADKDVTVIGAGASAVDVATLVSEAGARTRLVARGESVRFSGMGSDERSIVARVLHPTSGIGPGWRSWACQRMPFLFRFLPGKARLAIVRRHLGPKSPFVMKARFDAGVTVSGGESIAAATEENGRVRLTLISASGKQRDVVSDHIIAATGYFPDVELLQFMRPALRHSIRTHARMPVLSGSFESSVSGLYFVGPAAVNSFGPLMRFMVGAEYVAPLVARRLARRSRRAVPNQSMAPT